MIGHHNVPTMADILPFKKPKPGETHRGRTLCKSGFHRWAVVQGNPFDSKSGKLVTRYRCSRCGAVKVEAK
jgi:hypothetical protein